MTSPLTSRTVIVNLDENKVWVKETPSDIVSNYIGGRGVNAKYLWDLVKPKVNALSKNNVLIFGTGPFAGTFIPTSGQLTVTGKSPATELYCKSNAGGHWATELRYAGYNHVVVFGASQKPVYLHIKDDNIELRDASHLWGRDVRETNVILKKELKDEKAQVACIGQAGESLVKFASVMVSVYHAAARGGLGAVMGSKKLKAITVRGTREVFDVAHPELLHSLVQEAMAKVLKSVKAQAYFKYGTAGTVEPINEMGALPSFNFKEPSFRDAKMIGGVRLVEDGYIKGRAGCTACPFHCHKYFLIESGRYKCYAGGPEYETLGALGAGCGIGNAEAVLKMHELCNIYGLDGITAGAVIQWVMECAERNVLTKKDVDGLDVTWGDADVAIELLRKMAYREGFGNILAEGLLRAANYVGKESWKWAVQSKGLELSRIDTRSAKAYALAFAVNPRGPDHLHAQPIAEFGIYPESRELVKKLTGDVKYAIPYIPDRKAEIVRWHEDVFALTEVLGLCSFATTTTYVLTPELLAKMYTALVDVEVSGNGLMLVGRRVITLERCFNIREGLTRLDDVLPWRLMNEPVNKGPAKGLVNSREELDSLLDIYYRLHGWDKASGKPTSATLIKLNMKNVAEELKKLSLLPN